MRFLEEPRIPPHLSFWPQHCVQDCEVVVDMLLTRKGGRPLGQAFASKSNAVSSSNRTSVCSSGRFICAGV